MSEMVERVARAIYAREKMRKESLERMANHGGEGPWISLLLPYETQNEIYRDLARAAIEAMREPTVEMLVAAYATVGVPEKPVLANGYRAMIDQELKETAKCTG